MSKYDSNRNMFSVPGLHWDFQLITIWLILNVLRIISSLFFSFTFLSTCQYDQAKSADFAINHFHLTMLIVVFLGKKIADFFWQHWYVIKNLNDKTKLELYREREKSPILFPPLPLWIWIFFGSLPENQLKFFLDPNFPQRFGKVQW